MMAEQQFSWKRFPRKKRGILCGAEQSQQWLLPWWWSRYSEHNHFPVTFFDFGMTEEMRCWCAERGEVVRIDLNPLCIAPKSEIDERLAQKWEQDYGPRVWHSRRTWFKKPFAFLESAYERGIWIDLDCEVLGSLEPLFSDFNPSRQLALVRDYHSDHLERFNPNASYNGGVVVFEHGSVILEQWARDAVAKNHLFGGDDPLLSYLICVFCLEVKELPEVYNWRIARGVNLEAVILHWVGTGGKAYIRKYGGLKPSLDLLRN
jgi:hypothetical protein